MPGRGRLRATGFRAAVPLAGALAPAVFEALFPVLILVAAGRLAGTVDRFTGTAQITIPETNATRRPRTKYLEKGAGLKKQPSKVLFRHSGRHSRLEDRIQPSYVLQKTSGREAIFTRKSVASQ
jgi:hypothetical protein